MKLNEWQLVRVSECGEIAVHRMWIGCGYLARVTKYDCDGNEESAQVTFVPAPHPEAWLVEKKR